jgi:hypothetical protein
VVVGVGHDPEPVSFVWRTAVGSSNNAPFPHIPQRGQVSDDGSDIATGNKSWHVLKQNGLRLYVANAVPCCWPHVAFVVGSSLLAGNGEWLAGKACCNHVRKSSVLPSGTGLHELTHVSEDWRGWQVSVCDSGGNNALAVFVPFDIANRLPTK